MSSTSSIEWTDATWNPIIGCTKVSQGCKFCYAETFSERFRGVPGHSFEQGFDLRLVPSKLEDPLHWVKPRKVFTCSMSDVFHERVPVEYIQKIFSVMERAEQHTFQVLTKRSERLLELKDKLPWPKNVWMGVSVEDQDNVYRVRDLSKVPAAIRFLSIEPLLGPIKRIPLSKIDWVIVGGESGTKARPMDPVWALDIKKQCENKNVAFFLKQLGGRRGKRGGDEAVLQGKTWRQYPITVSF
jgi:protein gp37